jgi:hypothetical protein
MILRISHPMRGQLFYVDETGRMPTLRCEASLLASDNQAVKAPMQWTLHISDNIWPGACPSAKMGRQIMRLQGSSVGMGIWMPPFNTVCGGDATLTVSAQYEGEVYEASVSFRIRGKNPSPEAVLARMGGEHTPLTRLAQCLSALKQFDVQGMPFLGEHGEVGIMQLCDPAARWHQRWSWPHNVEAGQALLQQQQGLAKAYLDQHRIDGGYPNDEALSDAGVLMREMMQRFLGGAYWRWDEPNGQWRRNPPDDTLDKVLQHN